MSILYLNPKQMKLNEKIKILRLSKNLTQTFVAEELGIDAANYSRLERGLVKVTMEKLKKISEILEVNVSVFLDDNNSQEPKEIIELNSVLLLKDILKELKEINDKIIKNNQ
jgi:transcriptional regulator with XRE-family HTH domain